jgi:hypothetical protein
LNCDQSLHSLQVHGGALICLRRGRPARDQIADPRHLALEKVFARLEFFQSGLHLTAVESRQDVTFCYGLAFAIADLDDAVMDDACDLRPADGLDATGRVDDFDRRSSRRGHRRNLRRPRKCPPTSAGSQQDD